MESRRSYGWGYTGSDSKGFEWCFKPNASDPGFNEKRPWIGTVYSGFVYPSKEKAVNEGLKWLKKSDRSGEITAVTARPKRFEY